MDVRTSDHSFDSSQQRKATGTRKPARRRTLVEQVVEAIVARAARGVILPGDRLVETDIAQGLRMSRVPVREALRLLESQGLLVSTPYKGVRLGLMTRARLDQIAEVRIALEMIAARRAVALRKNKGTDVGPLERTIQDLERTASRRDAYGIASADAAFHRELCRLGNNDVLCSVWENLARPLTIIIGLSTFSKSMEDIVEEHRVLLDVLTRGRLAELDRTIKEHIRAQHEGLDFEAIIDKRRHQRESRQQSAARRSARASTLAAIRW
jgi:DNA-binding GntR family transcriptional regulator